jgi:hypothetical protein
LQKDDFMQRAFPGALPQSPDQKQELNVLAHDKSPERIGDLAQLEGFWKLTRPVPLVLPTTGPAPLRVEIRAGSYPGIKPVKIEFDMDGDGRPEWVLEAQEMGIPRTYLYQKEGDYEASFRLHDRFGQIHTYTSRVRVLSQAGFDAEIQAIWSNFKEALRRGDLLAAVDCIHTQSRNRYMKIFGAIPDLPQKVDEILTAIRFVNHDRGEAAYEMQRPRDGTTASFDVRFGTDVDGFWRISSF